MRFLIRVLPCAPLVAAFVVVGCGGGGGGGSAPNRPPTASFSATPPGGPPPLAVTFDASASGDPDGSITSYAWDFGTGTTGTGRSVEHTYGESGSYQVRLTVTDDDGVEASATDELVVNLLPTGRIVADPVDGEAPVAVTFDASLSTDEDGEIVSFDWDFAGVAAAGGVTAEYTFDAPGVYPVRLVVTDDLGGTAEVVFEVNARDDPDIAYTVPYIASGPYAEELRSCTYPSPATDPSCSLVRLPFLGKEFAAPTVEDVMTRVLVSHRWMGDSLRETLEQLPEDVRLLARSLTALVIASDIRPAHYRPNTGAIYLDAEYLWRTPEEQAVVTREADFRTGFGSRLQLRIPWRLVRNNVRWGTGDSRAEALRPLLAFLLYHELSHAADFMEVSRIDGLDPSQTVLEAIAQQPASWPSSRLTATHPLRSRVIKRLAVVSFRSPDLSTPDLEALRPDDVVDEFSMDGAVDFYSYSSQFEDLADLHDTILMSYHHGYEKDVGIVGTVADSLSGAIVAWGQRGRMTDPAVIDRTRWVIDALYPGDVQAVHGYLNDRPAPLPMRRGDTWADNVELEGGGEFNTGLVLPGAGLSATAFDEAWHPRLVGCIQVPDRAPAALRARLGLR